MRRGGWRGAGPLGGPRARRHAAQSASQREAGVRKEALTRMVEDREKGEEEMAKMKADMMKAAEEEARMKVEMEMKAKQELEMKSKDLEQSAGQAEQLVAQVKQMNDEVMSLQADMMEVTKEKEELETAWWQKRDCFDRARVRGAGGAAPEGPRGARRARRRVGVVAGPAHGVQLGRRAGEAEPAAEAVIRVA